MDFESWAKGLNELEDKLQIFLLGNDKSATGESEIGHLLRMSFKVVMPYTPETVPNPVLGQDSTNCQKSRTKSIFQIRHLFFVW